PRVANKGETRQPPRMSRISSAALQDLNAEQRAAVEHGAAPLLVIAGAGSGKTKTLSCRVAHLVAQGADPSRILLLTFSRRAASEMIARVGKALAAYPPLDGEGRRAAAGRGVGAGYESNASLGSTLDAGGPHPLSHAARDSSPIEGERVRIPWAGTFHAIGARLLRELAPVIGIDPEFTIHDRSDSA